MKKAIATLIALIAPLLVGAFTSWSFDVSTWQDISRFFAIVTGVTAAAITYLELT
jgi:VIT1/CCC1 family predicted Fe2+/Mn2+ transporter